MYTCALVRLDIWYLEKTTILTGEINDKVESVRNLLCSGVRTLLALIIHIALINIKLSFQFLTKLFVSQEFLN